MSDIIRKATRESYGETLRDLADKYENLVVLDADLAAIFPFSTDVIHLGADLFEGKQGTGIRGECLIHKILNAQMSQIGHSHRNGPTDSLLHILGGIT